MYRIMLNDEETRSAGIERVKLEDGKHKISIRFFYKKADSKEWLPAKQGVMIPVELEGRFRKAMRLCAEDEETFKVLEGYGGAKKKKAAEEEERPAKKKKTAALDLDF